MRARGFTLIELLLVIAIISILASLGLVVLSGVMASQRTARATHMGQQIDLAIRNFFAEYQQFPWPMSSPPVAAPAADILRELAPLDKKLTLGRAPTINRTRNYFTVPDKIPERGANAGTLVDPWGNQYLVSWDVASNRALVWSPGPDGADDTSDGDSSYGDDIHP